MDRINKHHYPLGCEQLKKANEGCCCGKKKNPFVAREARLPQRCLWQHTTTPRRAAAKCGCRRQGVPLPLRRRTMLLPFALAVHHHHPVDEERRATAPPLTVSSPGARCPRGSRAGCSLACVRCIGTLPHKATEKTRDPTNSGAEPPTVEALKNIGKHRRVCDVAGGSCACPPTSSVKK